MWIAKTKHFESVKLFVPSKVLMFREKPTLAANGGFYVTQPTDNGFRVAEYGTVIPEDMTPYADMLKEGECIEVMILPKPTIEALHTNPVYKSILDYGGEIRDNKIGDIVVGGDYGKRFEYCKNCGHPWCETGYRCSDCVEWHFDIDRLITKRIGQF